MSLRPAVPGAACLPRVAGKIIDARGVLVRVAGLSLQIGEWVRIRDPYSLDTKDGEVVGLEGPHALVMLLDEMRGLSASCPVESCGPGWPRYRAADLLGRVVDGMGRPLDGQGQVAAVGFDRDAPDPPSSLRPPIQTPLVTGIRVIDGLLTCGVGQRVGIFAPAGAGKSTLLGMLAQNVAADVRVVALIGERGREVQQFVADHLARHRASTIVIAATSDRPAAEKIRAAEFAHRVAAQLRDEGHAVVLLFDSLTRFARAARELGLALGEPAGAGGFPPSVYARLPRLVEMAGRSAEGDVSAFYTILCEDDEALDTISEEARSLLDGHLQLSTRLSNAGHYPAIDVLRSKSRLMSHVADAVQLRRARRCVRWLAAYQELELLIQVGEYRPGHDAQADEAIARRPALLAFLQQETGDCCDWEDTQRALAQLTGCGADGDEAA